MYLGHHHPHSCLWNLTSSQELSFLLSCFLIGCDQPSLEFLARVWVGGSFRTEHSDLSAAAPLRKMAPCPQHLLTTTSPQGVVSSALLCPVYDEMFQTQSCAGNWRAVGSCMQWPWCIEKIPLTWLISGLFASFGIWGIVLLLTGWPWSNSFQGSSESPASWVLALQAHTVTARLLGLFQEQEALNMLMIQIFWKSNIYLCKETWSWLEGGQKPVCGHVVSSLQLQCLDKVAETCVWLCGELSEHLHCLSRGNVRRATVLCLLTCVIVKAVVVYNTASRMVKSHYEDYFGVLCVTWNILKM